MKTRIAIVLAGILLLGLLPLGAVGAEFSEPEAIQETVVASDLQPDGSEITPSETEPQTDHPTGSPMEPQTESEPLPTEAPLILWEITLLRPDCPEAGERIQGLRIEDPRYLAVGQWSGEDVQPGSLFQMGKTYVLTLRFYPAEGWHFGETLTIAFPDGEAITPDWEDGVPTLALTWQAVDLTAPDPLSVMEAAVPPETPVLSVQAYGTASEAHTHRLRYFRGYPATIRAEGARAYYRCELCGKSFKDSLGKHEITDLQAWVVIPRLPHDHDCREIQGHPATDRQEGRRTYYQCNICGMTFEDRECQKKITDLDAWAVLPRLPHVHRLLAVPGFAASCLEDGRKSYYHCQEAGCEKNFADHEGKQEIQDLEAFLPVAGTHKMEYVPGRPADCRNDGWKDHWTCARCGRHFADDQGNTELEEVYVSALGCDWRVSYSWDGDDCYAERVCSRNPDHRETAFCKAVGYETELATCVLPGETTYLAVFMESWAGAQTRTVRNVPPTGHDWQEPVYSWSEDGLTCTADRFCANGHMQSLSAEAVREKVGETDNAMVARFSEPWAEECIRALPAQQKPQRFGRPGEKGKPVEAKLDSTGRFLGAVSAELPVSQLRARGEGPVSISCGVGEISYDSRAVASILEQSRGGESLRLLVEPRQTDDPELTEAQTAALRNHEGRLYSVTLAVSHGDSSRFIHQFSGGEASVTLPAAAHPGQRLTASRLEPDGRLTGVPCTYDGEEGTVTFRTGSHSYYLIERETDWSFWALVLVPVLAGISLGAWLLSRKYKA